MNKGSPIEQASPPGDRRAEVLERLDRETFDIAVIGGGITGAGIARDAAMRGLSVALLEKGDFASGTSGRSSRLVHGGLRYLRHRQIRLVREALKERGLLLRMAPHLVRPIPFVVPVFEGGRETPLLLRLGLAGYDVLAGRLGIGWHRGLSKEALARKEPQLRAHGLRGGVSYFDALTEDARLTLAVALSAVRQGAAALNYVEAVGLEKTDGRVTGVHFRDVIGDAGGIVRARVVVSAAGPWTDEVRSLAGVADLLRPTKGIHVVVPRTRLATNTVVAFGSGGRLLFAVPVGRHTYIGTTDTDYSGDPGAAEANRDDVAYVLEAINSAFEGDITVSDVVATWAGVRPLLREEGAPSHVSRDYVVVDGPPGLVTIAGGKLTTYRSMAENLVDRVVEGYGRRFSGRPGPCRTTREPLAGGNTSDFARYRLRALPGLRESWGMAEDAARRLIQAHGTDYVRVLASGTRQPHLLAPLAPGCPVLAVEAAYAAREEMAVTLEDFLRRRSDLMIFGPEDGEAVAEAAARVMAETLGWTPQHTEDQLSAYREAVDGMRAFSRDAAGTDESGAGSGRVAATGGGEGS